MSSQKTLRSFLKRRHPMFVAMAKHWAFLQATYSGGREWFKEGNIFRYMKEGTTEHGDRLERAYRFNHTREVVDLVDKHLFKLNITRSEDAPQCVRDFWKSSTSNNLAIDDYAKRISNQSSVNGRVWVVVDSNRKPGILTKAQEKNNKVKIYSYTVLPQYVLDMGYDDMGQLDWILIQENIRDDVDPITSTGEITPRFRLWTKTYTQLFLVKGDLKNESAVVTVEAKIPHTLGIVPVFPADSIISDDPYTSPALIADVAYLDRAVANYLSNLDAIIQDQTFSQLAIPAQGLIAGISDDDTKVKKLVEFGTKRIFSYDGEGGSKPFYLSPDIKQAEIILQVVNKIIGEIYHSVGLAGERTKDDNAQGIDNSSGVAKAYDFERVNALLAAKADSMEEIENRLTQIVCLYNGEEPPAEDVVTYPENFDVRSLYDEFEIAARLSLIEAPEGTRRAQMEKVIGKLFPQLKVELKKKLLDELKGWPANVQPEEPQTGAGGASAAGKAVKKEGKETLASALTKSKK